MRSCGPGAGRRGEAGGPSDRVKGTDYKRCPGTGQVPAAVRRLE